LRVRYKLVRLNILAIVCAWSLLGSAQDQLEKARAIYLNKEVTITDCVFRVASEQDGRYRFSDASPWLSNAYKGQTATVIAVQTKEISQLQPAKVNALGESIRPSDASSEVEFVVKFNDGTTALKRDSISGIKMWMLLPEEVAERDVKLHTNETKAAQLIGDAVYASALSNVYRADVTLAEMQDKNRIPVPLFVPLKVVASKWNAGMGCAIIKVEIPGGGSGLTLLSLEQESNCGYAAMLREIPRFLSPPEIKAVQRHEIERGMSTVALYYSIGMPERENHWGRGKQLIYRSGLYVYTDLDDKVVAWQQMGSN
jgi:hypothetical protein